jgi:2'-5' RNA ligase
MRAFIAATIPNRTLQEILVVQAQLKERLPQLRIEPANKIHITLHFLGEIGEDDAYQLWAEFESAFNQEGFHFSELAITGIEFFPAKNTQRGIWLSCEDSGTIVSIANLIISISERYGVQREPRAFRPHITLGRFTRGGVDKSAFNLDLQKLFGVGKFVVNSFYPEGIVLYRSILKKTGSEYTQIYKISLESRSGSNG